VTSNSAADTNCGSESDGRTKFGSHFAYTATDSLTWGSNNGDESVSPLNKFARQLVAPVR
jgi:hypothetical protein